MSDTDEASWTWTVLVNDEEQYALWPEFKLPPSGWRRCGEPGTRDECVAYVERHWTDMRPRSLRG